MHVHSFLHRDTETYTHVLADVEQQLCAVIDPVLDFDSKSGRAGTNDIDEVIYLSLKPMALVI